MDFCWSTWRRFRLGIFSATLICCALGCQQNPFAPVGAKGAAGTSPIASSSAALSAEQQTLLAKMQDLEKRLGGLDSSNSDLHKTLAQLEQEKRSYADQVALLQKQLADSGELAKKYQDQYRLAMEGADKTKQDLEKRVQAFQASTQKLGNATITPNNSVKQTLAAITIPGIEVRQEGEVIRIELPADRLFAQGNATLTPESYRILDEVSGAIGRSYPRQRVVIEGHTDNSFAATAGATHQLTAAQSYAVLQQMIQRRLPARQLSALAMGDNHPHVANGSLEGRAKNRRVEVVVYPDTFD